MRLSHLQLRQRKRRRKPNLKNSVSSAGIAASPRASPKPPRKPRNRLRPLSLQRRSRSLEWNQRLRRLRLPHRRRRLKNQPLPPVWRFRSTRRIVQSPHMMRTSWRSQPSCGVRPTDARISSRGGGPLRGMDRLREGERPATMAGLFSFSGPLTSNDSSHKQGSQEFVKIKALNPETFCFVKALQSATMIELRGSLRVDSKKFPGCPGADVCLKFVC